MRSLDTHFAWNPYPLSDAPYPYKNTTFMARYLINIKLEKATSERGIPYLSISDEVWGVIPW